MLKKLLIILPLLSCFLGIDVFAKNITNLEPLYSAQFTNKYVIIGVRSTGCTRPESFSIIAKGKGGIHYSKIGIVRDKPDRCKMRPHIITIHLELPGALAALKEPYKVENQFVSKDLF